MKPLLKDIYSQLDRAIFPLSPRARMRGTGQGARSEPTKAYSRKSRRASDEQHRTGPVTEAASSPKSRMRETLP